MDATFVQRLSSEQFEALLREAGPAAQRAAEQLRRLHNKKAAASSDSAPPAAAATKTGRLTPQNGYALRSNFFS